MYKIYGKDNCRYCNMSKELLDSQEMQYKYVDLSLDTDALEVFKSKGFRTVPIIYFEDELVGGYEALQDHLLEKIM